MASALRAAVDSHRQPNFGILFRCGCYFQGAFNRRFGNTILLGNGQVEYSTTSIVRTCPICTFPADSFSDVILAAQDYLALGGTIWLASFSNRGSPRSGSSIGSTLIWPILAASLF